MIKITLVLIALLTSKYRLPFLEFYLQYLHTAKQTTKMNKEDFKQGERLGARQQYAGGIKKRRFISLVRLSVHTNPLRKRSSSQTPLKPKECENAGFALRCGQKF